MSAQPNLDGQTPETARPPRGEMTILGHLLELRNRALVCTAAVLIGCCVCFYFWEPILGWLLAPGRVKDPGLKLASFSPTDRIGVIFNIGMYGGLALASPIVIYEILAFVVPGLTTRERRAVIPIVTGAVAFLCAGMAFAYWAVLPLSLGFLLHFGGSQINNVIGVHQYTDFVIRSMFFSGLAFELPIVLGILGWLGMVHPKALFGFWRYMILLVFIAACFIVPTPDPIDQSIVAVPLMGLYFVGIALVWLFGRNRRSDNAPESAA